MIKVYLTFTLVLGILDLYMSLVSRQTGT